MMENRLTDNNNTLKSVILIGGPAKGTRFRPLSLEQPKPLFPVAGFPIIYHHIEACCKLPGMKEILLIGFYEKSDALNQFMYSSQIEFKIQIRYLQEFTALGTAGGLYHFRDQILSGAPDLFFVMNADVCCDFPLKEMVEFHRNIPGPGDHFTMLATEATRQQSMQYGCIVENKVNHEVLHYVEKPQTYVSTSINCGIYLLSHSIFKYIRVAFLKHQEETYNQSPTGFDFNTHCKETIHLEQEVFQPLAGSGKLYVYHTNRFWSQIKSAGAAIYANRHYLEIYRRSHPNMLAVGRPMPGLRSRATSVSETADGGLTPEKPVIIGDVCIHPTASVASSAVLGPNVTIGRHVTVGEGVRVRESIILQGAVLRNHSCILNSIIGWYSIVGEWSRVEGSPNDPNPNKPFAKLEIPSVFNEKGQLNPSITVIGSNVEIPAEIAVLNSIVLPHKELKSSFKNQIIL